MIIYSDEKSLSLLFYSSTLSNFYRPHNLLVFLVIPGGIFSDSTIHDLHMSGWMMGAKPRTVYAQGNAFDPDVASCGDLDHVIVVIKYDGGAMSVIDNGRQANFGYDQRVEVVVKTVVPTK